MRDAATIRQPHCPNDSRYCRARRRGQERFATATVLVAVTLTIANCGTSGPNSLPSNIFIAIQPTNATLFLGQTQQFQATVTGASNTAVAWSVNAISGGSSSVGTVSATGLYTAPGVLPQSGSATVTATSQADQSVAVSVTVMLQDDIVVTVSP